MTSEEFKEWLKHHQAAFPGVVRFLGNISPEIRPETIALWQRTLGRISLQEAINATDTMLAESDRPRFYEDHPSAILLRTRRDKKQDTFKPRQIIDGEIAYACLDCKDTGYIVCWHPEAMRHYRNHGNLDECKVRTCIRACTCREGDQYEKSFGRFDARRWLVHSGVVSENESRLRHFLENSQDSRREKSFDQFR